MILTNKNYMDGYAILRYKSTNIFSWQDTIDFMQCFFDDLTEIQMLEYTQNQEKKPITHIHNGLLYLCPEFQTEKDTIILAGHSETSNADIKMTVFTNTNVVDLQVILRGNDYILGKFKNNDHVLDHYMDTLELQTIERKSIRFGIKKYNQYIRNLSNKEITEEFKEMCEDYQVLIF